MTDDAFTFWTNMKHILSDGDPQTLIKLWRGLCLVVVHRLAPETHCENGCCVFPSVSFTREELLEVLENVDLQTQIGRTSEQDEEPLLVLSSLDRRDEAPDGSIHPDNNPTTKPSGDVTWTG